jgi:hypothetical protein
MNVYAYGYPLAQVKAREVCVSGKPDYHAAHQPALRSARRSVCAGLGTLSSSQCARVVVVWWHACNPFGQIC